MAAATDSGSRLGKARGFRRLWRVLRQLFHEVTGALFAVLAFAWLNLAFRAWTNDVARWLVGVSIGVALVFVIFALGAFRRSRQF
jgi:hypothetical protein